jgi:hypothetical protein
MFHLFTQLPPEKMIALSNSETIKARPHSPSSPLQIEGRIQSPFIVLLVIVVKFLDP